MKNCNRISLAFIFLLAICWPCIAQTPTPGSTPNPSVSPSPWLGNLTAIISILAVLINAVAALIWGTKTIEAKNSEIQSLKTHITNLGQAHEKTVEAKNSEIHSLNTHTTNLGKEHEARITAMNSLLDVEKNRSTNLKEVYDTSLRSKDEQIKAKDDLIKEVQAQVAQLRLEQKEFKPSFWIDEYKRIKQEQEELIKSLRENLDLSRREITAREERIRQLEAEGDQNNVEVERLRTEIEQIKAKAEGLERNTQPRPIMPTAKVEILREHDEAHGSGFPEGTEPVIHFERTKAISRGQTVPSFPLVILEAELWNESIRNGLEELVEILTSSHEESTGGTSEDNQGHS